MTRSGRSVEATSAPTWNGHKTESLQACTSESFRRQPVSPISRMRFGRATGSGTGTPSMVTSFAPGVIGSEQTRMGKSPPGSERVRIGTAMLSIAAGGHCALSVMARASMPPCTY